jgi:hypothetical protein
MAIDQRDWYVDKLRRATRYVERAAFRVSLGEERRDRDRREKRDATGVLLGWFLGAVVVAGLIFWSVKHIFG